MQEARLFQTEAGSYRKETQSIIPQFHQKRNPDELAQLHKEYTDAAMRFAHVAADPNVTWEEWSAAWLTGELAKCAITGGKPRKVRKQPYKLRNNRGSNYQLSKKDDDDDNSRLP